MSDSLALIMPVYNEEDCIESVVREWIAVLDSLEIDYQLHAYNDGSRDGSLGLLRRLTRTHARLVVHDRANSGHGPTVLSGYRAGLWATWLFQVDSDNEIGTEAFSDFWRQRGEYDFLVGRRVVRHRPWSRRFVSGLASWIIRKGFGPGITDVNCPFRLMRTEKIARLLADIPETAFAPNVLLSAEAIRKKLRLKEIVVRSVGRQTGEASVRRWKLWKAAIRSFVQLAGAYSLNH